VALPRGNVFISRGLLEQLDNEAQLAHVLGHEMGHITARHVEERISQSQLVGVGASVAGAAVGDGSAASELLFLVVGLGGQGYLLKFGRDQESEADRQGVKYIVNARYDPTAAEDVMQVLIDADQGNRQWEILSTHPDPRRRLADVRQLIDEEYPHTRDSDKYKKHDDRFRQRAKPYLTTRE
jgi:predicted Zn-dependent protease